MKALLGFWEPTWKIRLALSVACAGLFIAVATLFFISAQRSDARENSLTRSAAVTTGMVTYRDPQPRTTVSYEFVVGGRQFRGKGSASKAMNVGDTLPVFYLPDDPDNNSIRRPSGSHSSLLVGGWITICVAMFGIHFRRLIAERTNRLELKSYVLL